MDMKIVRDLEKADPPEHVIPVFLRLVAQCAREIGKGIDEPSIVETYIYRGHRNVNWPLRAHLLRDPDNENEAFPACKAANLEYQLLQGFSKYLFAYRPDLFSASHGGAACEWRKMAIAQHYGVPTRFIDFSTSPLVALYFAVECDPEEENGREFDSTVWAVEAKNRREVTNVGIHITEGVEDLPPLDLTFLGLLFDALEEKEGEKRKEFRWPKEGKCDLTEKHTKAVGKKYGEFNNSVKSLSDRLLKKFNEQETDGTKPDYHCKDLSRIMIKKCVNTAFVPEDMDGRISAQSSVFMYEPSRSLQPSYTPQKAVEARAVEAKQTTFQVIIPAKLRDRIRVELNDLGINRASLFPDLQGAGKHLKWMISDQKRLDSIGRLGGDLKKMVYASERWKPAHEWE